MPGTFGPLLLCSFRLASRLVQLRGRLHLRRSVALHLLICAQPRLCRPYGEDGLVEPLGACYSALERSVADLCKPLPAGAPYMCSVLAFFL